jgi:aminoglycoside/choline kinase family phosphotransferase
MLRLVVTDEQHADFLERYKAARVAAGLPPLISDEHTLRMFAAVMASSRRRRAHSAPDELPQRAGNAG